MSKIYKIKIKGLNSNLINEGEKLALPFDYLPILSNDKMKELIKNKALEHGAKIKNDNIIFTEKDHTLTINLIEKKFLIELSKLPDLEIFVDTDNFNIENNKELKIEDIDKIEDKDLKKHINDSINGDINNNKAEIKNQVLKHGLNDQKKINSLLKDVYKDAIREKAQSLGNIVNISESDTNGEYRIRLEIT